MNVYVAVVKGKVFGVFMESENAASAITRMLYAQRKDNNQTVIREDNVFNLSTDEFHLKADGYFVEIEVDSFKHIEMMEDSVAFWRKADASG